MKGGARSDWGEPVRAALGVPGLLIAGLSLVMFLFGLIVVRRDLGRLDSLGNDLPVRLLSRWSRTASSDYLNMRNLVDDADDWRRAPPESADAPRAAAGRALERLGDWFESQNTRAPLLEVVEARLVRSDTTPPLVWRSRSIVTLDALRSVRVHVLAASETLPAVWLDVLYRPDAEVLALGNELNASFRRMLLAVVGLSGYSLLCLAYMAFHAHTARRLAAREAATQATIDLADRTCHELGNAAFVVGNEGRNLESLLDQLERLQREWPTAVREALRAALPDADVQAAVLHRLERALARRGVGLESDLTASTALARESWKQVQVCSNYIGLTVRELDRYLKKTEQPLNLAALDLRECVEDAAALLGPAVESAGLRIELGRGLERSEPPVIALADRRLLLHAVVNLLKNATEALRGNPHGVVTVSAHRAGGRALLEVKDNGPGVAPELRSRLFEAGASTKGPGRGRGLSVVRESIELQGGRVSLLDTERGACFVIDLNAAEPGQTGPVPTDPAPPAA